MIRKSQLTEENKKLKRKLFIWENINISINSSVKEKEIAAEKFLNEHRHTITVQSISHFANQINRDPSIVLGRLLNDGLIDYRDGRFKTLQKKYKIYSKVN